MKTTILISTLIAITTAIQLPNPEPYKFNITHPHHSNHSRISTHKSRPTPTTMITLPGGVFVQTTMPIVT
ncbi:hypothetical protein SBOR_7130 [Sclerotinia borealis F-4128]|uniref:Uncharacterized protein n=1 Tax=Sclerotinia borealis (strain F-4128) TaxID=1432307 RepID=W9C6T0_SCLBF|nr:hypothetical protein SBOR_7130 [Sclerotinia borealis F-4128]